MAVTNKTSEESTIPKTTFKDKKGRVWDVSLTALSAQRIDRSDFSLLTELKFSIIAPTNEVLMEIHSNVSLTLAMIWAVVYPQAEKYYKQFKPQASEAQEPLPDTSDGTAEEAIKERLFPVSPKESPEEAQDAFMEGMNGTVIKEARMAFWSAYADFIPDLATVLLSFLSRIEKMERRLEKETPEILEEVDQTLERLFTEARSQVSRSLREVRFSDLNSQPSQTPQPQQPTSETASKPWEQAVLVHPSQLPADFPPGWTPQQMPAEVVPSPVITPSPQPINEYLRQASPTSP